MLRLIVAAGVGCLSLPADACTVGPRTFHFRDSPLATWQKMGRDGVYAYFVGRVAGIERIANDEAKVAFSVVKVLSSADLGNRVETTAFFGDFPGGCGQKVELNEMGSYVVRLDGERIILMSH